MLNPARRFGIRPMASSDSVLTYGPDRELHTSTRHGRRSGGTIDSRKIPYLRCQTVRKGKATSQKRKIEGSCHTPEKPSPHVVNRGEVRQFRGRQGYALCSGFGCDTLGSASADAEPGGQSCRNQRASALPGSAISSIEPYHAASQPASGRPVNNIRLSG